MRLGLTKRGDYAVRAMLALARHEGYGRRSARLIADDMSIPVQFLPQVLGDLHRAGLVDAVTGRTGGYRLARSSDAITLLEVIEAVEGPSRRQTCVLRGGPCGLDGFCDVHAVFFAAQEGALAALSTATLASVVGRPGGAWPDGPTPGGRSRGEREGRQREVGDDGRPGERRAGADQRGNIEG